MRAYEVQWVAVGVVVAKEDVVDPWRRTYFTGQREDNSREMGGCRAPRDVSGQSMNGAPALQRSDPAHSD